MFDKIDKILKDEKNGAKKLEREKEGIDVMKMEYKLLGFDLDGTILTGENETDSTYQEGVGGGNCTRDDRTSCDRQTVFGEFQRKL